MTSKTQHSQPLAEAVAGFTAGVVSTLVAHPLDVLKTRLQGKSNLVRPEKFLQMPTFNSRSNAFVSIRRLLAARTNHQG